MDEGNPKETPKRFGLKPKPKLNDAITTTAELEAALSKVLTTLSDLKYLSADEKEKIYTEAEKKMEEIEKKIEGNEELVTYFQEFQHENQEYVDSLIGSYTEDEEDEEDEEKNKILELQQKLVTILSKLNTVESYPDYSDNKNIITECQQNLQDIHREIENDSILFGASW